MRPPTLLLRFVPVFVSLLASASSGVMNSSTKETVTSYPVEAFVRARCSTAREEETIVSWSGAMFSSVPGEPQRKLFGVYGINLARCWFNATARSWYLTSRELEYYLDPQTGEPVHRWLNPWTNETVTVAHVANDPVQYPLGNAELPAKAVSDGTVVFESPTTLFYPNPLFANTTFRPYSWQENYEGTEVFDFFVSESEILDLERTSAPSLHFSWTRVSQWLPWMKMGGGEPVGRLREGRLLSMASGARTSLSKLPVWMQKEIELRLPLYHHPPRCMLALDDSTSWTYFRDHFDEYVRGDQFPVPAAASPLPPCQ